MVKNSEDQLTLFAGDTHASHSVPQASERARKMSATSGRKCLELYAVAGLDTSLPKMLLDTLLSASMKLPHRWKMKASPSGRLLFQLAPLAPPTDEIEFGLWQTPNVPNGGRVNPPEMSPTGIMPDGTKRQVGLEHQVRMVERGLWPTPLAIDGEKSGHGNLPHLAKLYPTPCSRDWKDTPGMAASRPDGKSRKDQLARVVYAEMWPTPMAGANNPAAHNAMSGDFKKKFCERAGVPITGTLNPQFVEWLMGFPIGYTALED